MDYDSDEERPMEEDYYTFLNVAKDASKDDINTAYRRLSRLYHPDKHVEINNKQKAELLFNKTKKAYEVLSDPHRRAIYDTLGVKGLETDGLELVQKTRTPAEIREDYERLAEERAERKKNQRTNPHGFVTININATDLFDNYKDELMDELDFDDSIFPNVEVSGMTFNQSVEFPLTSKNTCTMSGTLNTKNGNGSGDVSVSWRHLYSHKAWTEVEVAAGNGPALSFKGFRTLSKRFFWNGGAMFHLTPDSIRPGLSSTIAMQIDNHSVAYLTYQGGLRSLLSTSLVRDTEYSTLNIAMQVGLPHSFVMCSFIKKMLSNEMKLKIVVKAGTFGGLLEYGVEKKVSKHSNLAASVSVGVPSGVKLKIRLTRANQVYSFPIHLCEEMLPAPIFYATIVPLVTYIIIKKGFVDPFVEKEKAKKAEKNNRNNRDKLLEKKREAQAAIDLMTAAYSRILDEEEAKKGLIIVKAIYGNVVTDGSNSNPNNFEDEVIEVTIPLQCLVKDSKLILHESPKSQLPGFFDITGKDKMLHIVYNYRQQPHEVTIKDNEVLRIPKTGHKLLIVT